MDDCNIFEALGQVSSSEAGSIFRKFLRGGVRQLISEVMAEEVTALCGPKHHPVEGDYVRFDLSNAGLGQGLAGQTNGCQGSFTCFQIAAGQTKRRAKTTG